MRATTKRGRVLVVDDQPANLRVVSALLERQGFDVALAETGEAALDAAEAEPPDLLLLDMMMPGMDGFGVMQEIRRRELPKVPVVFLTAAQDRGLLLQAFEAGAVDYVIKPFIPEELLARVHAHIGLKLARDRLEQVARERQELVNLVAHDLKNPLTSVVFAADILASGTLQPDRVPRYLQVIRESAEDGLGYIRRYLETQASARGAASARDARVALGDVVEWIIGRYGLQFEDSGCRLSIGEVGGAVVAMDGLVLRQVVGNLISNAMKYAPGSDVDISASAGAPGYWQLRVADRGPGVSRDRQRALFTPFARLHDFDPARAGASSGLGLSLARQIVSNAGGQLWYEDREGGGACFVVELPEAAGES
ncbi:MAG: HAMP domain-containing histidine kinase [Gammaproteobacteria bacterium]|jgi:signal transduction histidine kinase|nr:HAMP domain-containing histidine kinase [Gammaproteobacteria bacterium]